MSFNQSPEESHTTTPDAPPSPDNGGPVCPQCGAVNPPGSTICRATPTCGSFLPANDLSVVHRGYAKLLLERADVQAAMQSERDAVERDLGGDPTTIKSNLTTAYVQAKTIRESMFEQMSRTGVKGQAFARFLAVLDREMRLAALLGLERKAKPMDTIAAIMRQHAEGK